MKKLKAYQDYSDIELTKKQKVYSKRDFLSVEEAAIWLELTPDIVRKYLRKGKIVGMKPFNSRIWKVDVKRTRKLMDGTLNVKCK